MTQIDFKNGQIFNNLGRGDLSQDICQREQIEEDHVIVSVEGQVTIHIKNSQLTPLQWSHPG